MARSQVKRDGRPNEGVNEEELRESLKWELMEKCTPQFCSTCRETFLSQDISKAHFAGRPHQRLLQMKLKVMLRQKISKDNLRKIQANNEDTRTSEDCEYVKTNEDNLRKIQGNSKFVKSVTVATEIKQDVTIEISADKNCTKEETRKRPGDHLQEVCNLSSSLLEKCLPTFCGVCSTYLDVNRSRSHYTGKPHKKRLKLMDNFACNLCQITTTSKKNLEMHRLGSKHKSKEAQQVKFFCDACYVSSHNEDEFKRHLIGKPHAKKLRMIKLMQAIGGNAINGQGDSEVSTVVAEKHENLENADEIAVMIGEKASENSVIKAEKIDDSDVKKVPDLNDKTGDTKSIPDISDSVIINLKRVKDRHKEFMSMQAEEMMFGNTSEESVIKDEEMDGTNAKDIPELSDSPISKLGHIVTDTELMSMKAKDEEVDVDEAKDVSDLCDSMSDLAGHSDLVKNNELKIKLNLKYKELLHPPEIDKIPKIGEVVSVTEALEVKKSVQDGDEKEASSDDDLIILENPDSLSPKKPVQSTPKLNNDPVIESVKLCVYPLGQTESVTVSTQDYATLAYDTFLNDIIIDFYLLYLSNTVLPNADKENVYIFSTMFYKRLLQKPGTNPKKVPQYETDSSLTLSEIRHFRVASWTKNVDLFKKDMIVIPICEESHWYLLIVVRPGSIFLPVKERRKKGEPFVIVLDSVGGKNGTAVKNMRRYLACEWKKKKCHGVETLAKLEEIGKSMNTVRPNKPEQENNSDCGIFLLQYVEKVFQNVSAFLWPFLVNSRSKEWFTSEEVGGKRGEIAQLIKRLAEEQKPGEVIEYPEIKFTEKGS